MVLVWNSTASVANDLFLEELMVGEARPLRPLRRKGASISLSGAQTWVLLYHSEEILGTVGLSVDHCWNCFSCVLCFLAAGYQAVVQNERFKPER
ncbi:hypothetical protein CDAR_203821 [Caerostris darwini]|uniref:Uncharacterized protein n=1 Tax=Caerostris darwini TaxID=1538125 RepID=A0AAV4P7E2_9ARAC|nr:hypothetical protein CDAR_203821 [Caerostris darwini]